VLKKYNSGVHRLQKQKLYIVSATPGVQAGHKALQQKKKLNTENFKLIFLISLEQCHTVVQEIICHLAVKRRSLKVLLTKAICAAEVATTVASLS
jgi:hypothetical protein